MNRVQFGRTAEVLEIPQLLQGICSLSVYSISPILEINHVILWKTDGSGIMLFNQMHDIAERMEVGILSFEWISTPVESDLLMETIDLDPAFQGELTLAKLVIEESGTVAESGIEITAANGATLIVVASAFPCNVVVQGVHLTAVQGIPEYPLDCYQREMLTTLS